MTIDREQLIEAAFARMERASAYSSGHERAALAVDAVESALRPEIFEQGVREGRASAFAEVLEAIAAAHEIGSAKDDDWDSALNEIEDKIAGLGELGKQP